MLNLNYTARGFPSCWEKRFHGSHSMKVTWKDLFRAAITVGRKSWDDVVRHGHHSRLEIIYRSTMIGANLSSSDRNEFTKTDAYKSLDPSEKSAISYFLGLSFAKLAAEQLLGIPWLVHLDCLSDLSIDLRNSCRPDLVGVDYQGRWGVFEAKGRTNNLEKTLIQKAKKQTQMVRKINGSDPWVRVASISYFLYHNLKLHLEDPDEIHSDAIDFEIPGGEDQFLKYYYQPFISLIENSQSSQEEVAGRTINVVELVEIDLAVGLDAQVQEILTSVDSIRPRLSNHLEGITQRRSGNDDAVLLVEDTAPFLGPDGILVRLGPSWETIGNAP